MPPEGTLEEKFALRHKIDLEVGGVFERILKSNSIIVNSLHGQGIDKAAPGMTVEATAPDSTIEALSINGGSDFSLGVQWHPEFYAEENVFYSALFKSFGNAAKVRAEQRRSTR